MTSTERQESRELTVEELGFEELYRQNDLLNEKSRRLIMSALEPYPQAPFAYLGRATGLSDGNISGHLTKLENAGLVYIEKTFEGKKPKTFVGLTDNGRAAIDDYWHKEEKFIEKRKRRSEMR